ncbi:hypothetical protein [Bacillus pseudomycoides]|uniref:hypothetical protein n=1 Tax=Bacillus pseudomycoides TaxID=64104 RepID=UPI0015CF6A29|nr:hypothetical protein [Bacillus pseudomycoides]
MFDTQEIQHALNIFIQNDLIVPLGNGQTTLQIAQKQVDFMCKDDVFSRLKEQSYL